MKKEVEKLEEKNLVWRLSEKPSGHVVAELVAQGVISKEEARSILFKVETKQTEEVEALRGMVDELLKMVKDLANRPSDIKFVPYERIVEIPVRHKPYWTSTFGDTMLMSPSRVVGTSGNTTCVLSTNSIIA